MSTTNLGEKFQAFITANDTDAKGREFGFIVELQDNIETGECLARVQCGIKTKDSFKKFGALQPQKTFTTPELAQRWAYSTAKERAAKRSAK